MGYFTSDTVSTITSTDKQTQLMKLLYQVILNEGSKDLYVY